MGILKQIEQFLSGKKTYLIMLLVAVGAVAQYQGVVIPDYVWSILAALGLGAVKSAISKSGN